MCLSKARRPKWATSAPPSNSPSMVKLACSLSTQLSAPPAGEQAINTAFFSGTLHTQATR
jgi:hypothetical protein